MTFLDFWFFNEHAFISGGTSGKESACQCRRLGQEDPLEEEMATYSRILALEIPGTEEAGGLQSMGVEKS